MTAPLPLLYRFAADGVVLIHLLFVLFVICGGLLVRINRRWAIVHLPAVLWAATVEFTGWYCPLTPLENRLRQESGGAGYNAGFVEHYLLPLLYPEALTREVQIGLGLLVLAINVLWYWLACRRRPPAPAHPGPVARRGQPPDSTGPGSR